MTCQMRGEVGGGSEGLMINVQIFVMGKRRGYSPLLVSAVAAAFVAEGTTAPVFVDECSAPVLVDEVASPASKLEAAGVEA